MKIVVSRKSLKGPLTCNIYVSCPEKYLSWGMLTRRISGQKKT